MPRFLSMRGSHRADLGPRYYTIEGAVSGGGTVVLGDDRLTGQTSVGT
nr:hypothetical protein [Kibdelosporangium sp. MJ126-NF4]CTQ96576.1 hypothetical protein [Kibdelosporangium sp. MJ126-NF4]